MSLFEPLPPEVSKALNKSVRYLSFSPRTQKETRIYLEKKGFDEECIQSVINLLVQDRYLDDRVFAEMFINSRKRNNPKSKFALGMELRNKGVSCQIIDEFLEDLNDLELALSAVERKMEFWLKSLDRDSLKKKIFNFLSYRGFSYDVIQQIWHQTLRE